VRIKAYLIARAEEIVGFCCGSWQELARKQDALVLQSGVGPNLRQRRRGILTFGHVAEGPCEELAR
jgi:hypothetical protein